MKLVSRDVVTVKAGAFLELLADDKHIGAEGDRNGGYSSTPNTVITSGSQKLDSETERLENEYFMAHKADIDQYFIDNLQSAFEIYSAGGKPELPIQYLITALLMGTTTVEYRV